jgi:hypothetical protein
MNERKPDRDFARRSSARRQIPPLFLNPARMGLFRAVVIVRSSKERDVLVSETHIK